MIKKTIFIASLLLLVYCYFVYNPIIVKPNNKASFVFNPELNNMDNNFKNYYDYTLKAGDTLNLFEHFNFNKGNWKAFVFFYDRRDVSKTIPKGKCLVTTDIEIIKEFKHLSFEFTEGDACTVLDELIIYCNNKIAFRCNVVLDTVVAGFQSSQFGWIESKNKSLSNVVKKFHKPINLIIFL